MSLIAAMITDDGVAVVSPSGRVNMVSAPKLRDDLHALVEEGHHRVVVDLSGVDFLDSAGLGTLIFGLKLARAAGGGLRIAAPNRQAKTVLQVANLVEVFNPYESVEAAAADWV